MNKSKSNICGNCFSRSKAFKIGKLTHYHCYKLFYLQQYNAGNNLFGWETLRVFNDTCKNHIKNPSKAIYIQKTV